MKMIVNGLEIGWDGITVDERLEQHRLAALPEVHLGRSIDVRRDTPYGRLVPLRKVHDGRCCSYRFSLWLCRCTCWKGKLTVVMAANLLKSEECGGSRSCGCLHSERASANLASLKEEPEFQRRQAEAATECLLRYHQEHAKEVSERSRANVQRLAKDPRFIAARVERFRRRRIERNYHPDTPISTHYTRIRHAITPLTNHILRVRDDFACALCKVRGKVTFAVHHIVPVEESWARVGDPSNLVTLCFECHFKEAHASRWNTVDPIVQSELHRIAADQECARKTPRELVILVQERLAVLGRELGRA